MPFSLIHKEINAYNAITNSCLDDSNVNTVTLIAYFPNKSLTADCVYAPSAHACTRDSLPRSSILYIRMVDVALHVTRHEAARRRRAARSSQWRAAWHALVSLVM